MPTDEVLAFGLAHARARDAVLQALDVGGLEAELRAAGFETVRARSAARDRREYLLRPDLGRCLAPDCAEGLQASDPAGIDVCLVVADGLSSIGVQRHAVPLLQALRECMHAQWTCSPVVVVEQGRVAIGDEIGESLKARIVAVVIGERPGLSSPDSLGIYLTYAPRRGRTDGERNCISNIRPEGLGYADAARKAIWLIDFALRRHLTGVGLKDESDFTPLETDRVRPAITDPREKR